MQRKQPMSFEDEFKRLTDESNEAISRHLAVKDSDSPGMLAEALRYSVLAGGKRLRPILMKSVYELFGGREDISAFMAAMEFIHISSLIHDDLPALDNDALRHGKPSTHAKYGEVLGILSGDALLNYAYEVLLDAALKMRDPVNAVKAAGIIAEKTGYRGMLGGQDADTEADKGIIKIISEADVAYIYEKKTCALFEAAMMAGACLAGAGDDNTAIIESVARDLGLAFQIRDDILDLTADEQKLGKPVMSDIRNNKATYVSMKGIEASEDKVSQLTESAVKKAASLPGDTGFIIALIEMLAGRDH